MFFNMAEFCTLSQLVLKKALKTLEKARIVAGVFNYAHKGRRGGGAVYGLSNQDTLWE